MLAPGFTEASRIMVFCDDGYNDVRHQNRHEPRIATRPVPRALTSGPLPKGGGVRIGGILLIWTRWTKDRRWLNTEAARGNGKGDPGNKFCRRGPGIANG